MNFEPGSFLARLSDDQRQRLLAQGRRTRYPRGAAIFTEGEESTHVIALLSGRVKIVYADAHGRETVFGVQGPGDLLGELSAIDHEPRSGAVFALEAVEAVAIAAERFTEMVVTTPALALVVLRLVAGRLRDADRKRIEFGAYSTEHRVARRLVELAQRYGDSRGDAVHIRLRLTQEELAGWTSSSREAVAKALATFRAHGWIDTGRRQIVVLDLDALMRRYV